MTSEYDRGISAVVAWFRQGAGTAYANGDDATALRYRDIASEIEAWRERQQAANTDAEPQFSNELQASRDAARAWEQAKLALRVARLNRCPSADKTQLGIAVRDIGFFRKGKVLLVQADAAGYWTASLPMPAHELARHQAEGSLLTEFSTCIGIPPGDILVVPEETPAGPKIVSAVSGVGAPPLRLWSQYRQAALGTFRGGYSDPSLLTAYQHGLETVFSLLENEFPQPWLIFGYLDPP